MSSPNKVVKMPGRRAGWDIPIELREPVSTETVGSIVQRLRELKRKARRDAIKKNLGWLAVAIALAAAAAWVLTHWSGK